MIKIYRIIIELLDLYGYETLSLKIKEERILMVFENRVLKGIFGLKRDEMTGGCRKSHAEDIDNLYSSPNIVKIIKSRKMRWAGHVGLMVEIRNVYKSLVGKPEVEKPLRRSRCR
jgi:hypothetical protein